MRPSRRLLIFLTWFTVGLLTPVLSLLLLERGSTLETLPLIMGAYSATVILCEVPSGVFADLVGRKRTFLLSCALYGCSVASFLLMRGVWALLPGIVLYGLGRAFSSGSLDALFLEECVAERGEGAMATATGQLSLWQSLGLTAGALVGGAIPNWKGYSVHLLVKAGLLALTATLCFVLVREKWGTRTGEERQTLKRYLGQSARLLRGNRPLLGLGLCFLAGGVLLCTIETFWQPAFMALAAPEQQSLLGVVSAAGFAAASLGNLAIRWFGRMSGKREWSCYLLLQIAISAAVAALAFQRGVPGFLLSYGAVYLILGGAGVLEQTLLNRMVPDGQRAGMLSASSLALRMGGLLACGYSSVAVGPLGFSGLLLLAAAIISLCALCAWMLKSKEEARTA